VNPEADDRARLPVPAQGGERESTPR